MLPCARRITGACDLPLIILPRMSARPSSAPSIAPGPFLEAHSGAAVVREKVDPLGPEHPHVATALENYAALLRKTGRTTEATKMEARARAIRAKHAR